MLTQNQAVKIVLEERQYQDRTYLREEVLASGITREQRDLDITPHLILLDEYVEKAKRAWVKKGGTIESLREVAKIAAIAVRALERVGGGTTLLVSGLRPNKLTNTQGITSAKDPNVSHTGHAPHGDYFVEGNKVDRTQGGVD